MAETIANNVRSKILGGMPPRKPTRSKRHLSRAPARPRLLREDVQASDRSAGRPEGEAPRLRGVPEASGDMVLIADRPAEIEDRALAGQVHAGRADDTPEPLRRSPGLRAIYNTLVAASVTGVAERSPADGWREADPLSCCVDHVRSPSLTARSGSTRRSANVRRMDGAASCRRNRR